MQFKLEEKSESLVDDAGAMLMARSLVKRIEEEMEYPGQIKINVIRETRSVDYAK